MDSQPAEARQTRNALLKPGKDHSIDMTGLSSTDPRPSPLPFPLLPAERIAADPTFTSLTRTGSAGKVVESVKLFTIGMLQQYTNSFSQENLIGKGTLGTVYCAQLPKGKVSIFWCVLLLSFIYPYGPHISLKMCFRFLGSSSQEAGQGCISTSKRPRIPRPGVKHL